MTELEGKKEETEAAKKIIHTYPLIRHSDMIEEMKGEVMELVVTACEKHSTNNEMAARMIKETMDKKFGPSWHTVVGEGFGFEISYESFALTLGPMWQHIQWMKTAPSTEVRLLGPAAEHLPPSSTKFMYT